ncbi:MAG: TIGR03960 family B12-binding radical SAM protein [Candidatus Aquicultorales bacterium]
MSLWPRIERLLPRVEKPARYINGELNSSHRSSGGRLRVALAYPDTYEVGLSNLGLQILYELINTREDAVAERTYAPWVDMEAEMREAGVPLFALESDDPVADFDILGFTLQYELTYTNILNMLDLAGIPVFAAERMSDHPLVIAGGPGAFAPEPIAPFFDAVAVGDGELLFPDIIETAKKGKEKGLDRPALLKALAVIPGVYVPSLYEAEYLEDGRLASIVPTSPEAPSVVERRVLKDLNQAPLVVKPIVPLMDSVHDRSVLEIMRGCTRGCRFCQAGMIYRPVRERSAECIIENGRLVMSSCGFDEISLSSLSSTDHSRIEAIVGKLAAEFGKDVAISLPSSRVDTFSIDVLKQIARSKKTGVTLAPEAGTQRMRDLINKGVTEDDIYGAARKAFEAGWQRVKLYFMIGLPTETMEDVEGIVRLTSKVAQIGRDTLPKGSRGRLSVTASVSSFVPKAHTPFQWEAQDTLETIEEKQRLLKDRLRDRNTSLRWHDSKVSALEGVLARGDRRVARGIYEAWKSGRTFDAWSDRYDYGAWLESFARVGLDPVFFANRRREIGEALPWSHIDSGVTEEFLRAEYGRSLACATTGDCRFEACADCGVCTRFKLKNVTQRRVKGGKAAS